jgi:hypothetical protein
MERHRWIEKSKNLLNEINDLACAADKKALIKPKEFAMPNFAEEAEMLEWAGISFGEEDTYRLGKSIKVSIRTFNSNDYYLVEIGSHERR